MTHSRLPLRSLTRKSGATVGICALLMCVFSAQASPSYNGPITVDQIFQTEMNGKMLTCGGLIKGAYVSGELKTLGDATSFVPKSVRVQTLKTKMKNEKDEEKRELLKARAQRLSKAMRDENRICTQVATGGTPVPTGTASALKPTATPGALFTPMNTPTARPTSSPTATPTRTPAPPPSNTPSAPSLTQGKILYDLHCARCHKLGSYDPVGGNVDLKGRGDRINPGALLSSFGIVLTPQDVVDLRAFLNTQQ